jgi:hypothetical protein
LSPDKEQDKPKSEKLPVRDNLLVAAQGALSFVPHVGSVLALLLDKYVPTTLQTQRDELLAELHDDLERVKRKISDDRLRSQAFNVMLVRVLRDALVESTQEKKAAFRAILLNEAIAPSPNPEADLFVKITEDLTVEHIQTLRVLHDPERLLHENPQVSEAIRSATGPNQFRPAPLNLASLLLQPALPHIPKDHWKVLLTGLARYGLIEDMGEAWDGWDQAVHPSRAMMKRTTALGDRYIAAITFSG